MRHDCKKGEFLLVANNGLASYASELMGASGKNIIENPVTFLGTSSRLQPNDGCKILLRSTFTNSKYSAGETCA